MTPYVAPMLVAHLAVLQSAGARTASVIVFKRETALLRAYGLRDGRFESFGEGISAARKPVLWIDLHEPTAEEEKAVETLLGFEIPTRNEMAEIEDSSRLYVDAGSLVLTVVMIDGFAENRPSRTQVTFVLTRDHLVSVRYADPLPFRSFASKCLRQPEAHSTADRIFASLVETIIARIADVLEAVATDLKDVSNRLFVDDRVTRKTPQRAELDLQAIIRRLGRKKITIAILRESLLSISRLVPFVRANSSNWLAEETIVKLKQIDRDTRSLIEYEHQFASDISYLQEATLGLISLDQNRIIKVFSIAAVLFLPPTLVGTIYGMNFETMPELKWFFGYPFAIGLMIASAIVPYVWFRRRGWL